ncbi:endo-1,4-beta-xylanase [Carboxylicivirga marina]|uniref:endo-1,4-beta-xylanase n=1 Tax=Carboxylicivirga marina TaxID=2800988 RepID=UPI00259ABEB7|nr:endo-1,4-beta-xylanase [uncultured Carboxylicivirga sp.]
MVSQQYRRMTLLSIVLSVFILASLAHAKAGDEVSFKNIYKGKFLIGVALNDQTLQSNDKILNKSITKHYNSIVAENCMKMERVNPGEGEYDFSAADQFVAYGERNNMIIIGHTLIWHSQAPDWIFFEDDKGGEVSREVLIDRMRSYIHTVVGRYKGRVHGWDVVNEAILANGCWRESKWFKIIGPEYIELAFKFAHEADPDAELYYNDYGMTGLKKRNAVVKLVNTLKHKQVRVDGIGMQAHYGLNLSLIEFEKSVEAFVRTGLKLMVTELDISVLPFPQKEMIADVNKRYQYAAKLNPYTNSLPQEILTKQTDLYKGLFKILLKYSHAVSRVTFWGLNDAYSWKNNWPIKGRTDYPLLFDRDNSAKLSYKAIVQLVDGEVVRKKVTKQ